MIPTVIEERGINLTKLEITSSTRAEVDFEEIYWCCIIDGCIYERPELKLYWGHDGSLDKLKPISDNIEYKLFLDIKNSIGIDNKNKLNQIVCQQAAFMIAPTVEMAVDEQLRLFTGAYVNKMKMPSKPAGEGCHA